MRRLRIKNWAEFQHYRTRRPPWIKLHRGLLDDLGWHRLPETSRAVGPMLWLLASEHADGVIPYDLETIAFRLHMTADKVDAALGPLIGAGFVIEEHDASEPLAAGKQPASPESERESESESERDTRAHEPPNKIPETTVASAVRARPGPSTSLRAGPSTSLRAGPSTSLRAGPSASLGAGPSASLRAGSGLAQPIHEGWQPGEADRAWAAKARPDLAPSLLEAETERFRNHAIGNNRLAHDWGHLWRNWVMKAALDAPGLPRRPGSGGAAASLPSVRMSGPDGLWKIRLAGYRPGDPWKYEGDPPGGADCRVPAELIPHWRAYLRELEGRR
jgi:hypothetical protein